MKWPRSDSLLMKTVCRWYFVIVIPVKRPTIVDSQLNAVHVTTINKNYGLSCIKMQAQLVTISRVVVAKLQSWTTKVPHFPEKWQVSVTHCAGHTPTNIISCIGWLKGRVATAISCRLWVFLTFTYYYYPWHITHTRKDTKFGLVQGGRQ